MSTWFDTLPATYSSLESEKGIDTVTFLRSTEGLITLFDIINPTAFGPVKSDMTGNVAKIRTVYEKNPAEFAFLEDILKSEAGKSKRPATEGLVWLLRGLSFTAIALRRNLDHPTEELAASFNYAYGLTLKPYHNFIVKGVFALAMKACPYRKDFYQKLGFDQDRCAEQLEVWLSALERTLAHLQAFIKSGDYDKGI